MKKIFTLFAIIMMAVTNASAQVEEVALTQCTWGWGTTAVVQDGKLNVTLTNEWGSVATGWEDPTKNVSDWDYVVVDIESMSNCTDNWLKVYMDDYRKSQDIQIGNEYSELTAPCSIKLDLSQTTNGWDRTQARYLGIQAKNVDAQFTISRIYFAKKDGKDVKNYYLVGDGILGCEWNADTAPTLEVDATTGYPTISGTVKAGIYNFRLLTTKGSWDNTIGYSDIDAEHSSKGYEAGSNDNNIKVSIPQDSEFKIEVVDGKIRLTGTFGEVTINAWTIAGYEAVLGSNWSETDTNNDMTYANGVWTLVKNNVTLTAGTYEYKVVGDHNWATNYPGDNAKLTIAEDGVYNVVFVWNASTKVLAADAEKVAADAINSVSADKSLSGKYLLKNKVVIIKNGKNYSTAGQLIK